MHNSFADSGADISKKSRDSLRGPFFSSPFFLVFALSLGLYLFLLPPSIARGGDCGELIAASYNLGIAHPSGYPVWSLLGRIFALIPVGEIAWRYNFFSALCAALATAIIATTAHGILKAPNADSAQVKWSATGAGLLLTGFFFFGSQALLAEVYALAALEGAALLFLAVRWKREGDWRDFYTLAWLAGLSPLIHLSGVFLWPFLALWACWKQKGMNAGRVAIAFLLGSSGLLFALYFPIRSGHFPAPPSAALESYFYFPLDWGHPSTFPALKNHLTAAQYSDLLKPKALPDLLENIGQLGQFLLFQYLWATPLLLWGAVAAFRRGLGWILLTIFALNIGVEIQYDVSDQANFFFPAYLVMAIWMALGWFSFFEWLVNKGRKLAGGSVDSLWPWRLQTLGTMLLLATIGAQWLLFSLSANQSGTIRPRDGAIEAALAAQQLAKAKGKPVAALYVHDDTLWPFWYAKYVLGLAPDVETPWGRGLGQIARNGQLWQYVAQLKKKGPVVLAQWDHDTDQRFPLVMLTPSGNLCVASDSTPPPAAVPLTEPVKTPTPGANGLLAARFRRAELWRDKGTIPAFSPASMAAFEVDFRVGQTKPQVVEVLMAHEEEKAAPKPAPTQDTVAVGSSETGRVLISKQYRRVNLPQNVKEGQNLRLAVPLQIEATFPVGKYKIWTRLLASPQQAGQIAWTLTDEIRLSAK